MYFHTGDIYIFRKGNRLFRNHTKWVKTQFI